MAKTEDEIVAAEMHWLHVNLTLAQEELGRTAKILVEDALRRAVQTARDEIPEVHIEHFETDGTGRVIGEDAR